MNYEDFKEKFIEDVSDRLYEQGAEVNISVHEVNKLNESYEAITVIRELNLEYEQVLQEKKKTYAEYRKAREELKDYQTAKYNVDQFLQKEEQEKQAEKQKTKEETL